MHLPFVRVESLRVSPPFPVAWEKVGSFPIGRDLVFLGGGTEPQPGEPLLGNVMGVNPGHSTCSLKIEQPAGRNLCEPGMQAREQHA